MFSQTAEYALRAIVYLGDQGGEPRTTAQIAEVTRIPAGYLAKVMQQLGKAKLVHAQRGLNGGFTLLKRLEELSLLTVINAVDPIRRYPECPLRIPSHGTNLCPLHRKLDDAAAQVEETLAQATVADMLAVPQTRRPLCRFPTSSS